MSTPKKRFWTLPQTHKGPVGPQKAKNNSKIKLKLKVRFEGSIENKSCSSIWVDPKSYPDLKIPTK